MGTERESFRVLQVSNISPQATKDQVQQLFGYLGRINDFKLYPSDQNVTSSITQKFAYVKFDDEKSVELGQHLTNTVLIDRAIVCVPSIENNIPDEQTTMNMGGPVLPGQRNMPAHLINRVEEDMDGNRMLVTIDPTLEQLGLPPYPALPENTEMSKVEEIRRTIYVGNLPKGVSGQDVVSFFDMNVGEVMYVRMTTGPESLPCAYAFVEFSAQQSVIMALQNNMVLEFEGRLLKIQHSRVAIIKPQRKTADQAVEEIEEAIRKKETGLAYMAARSRTRSPSRRREGTDRDRDRERRRSRSRSPRRRSRSRERRRSRSRGRRESKRSRSRDRKRSRSKEKDRRSRRSRSRDRDRKRSRTPDKKDRDRDRKRDKEKKEKEKDRKRSRSRTPKKKDAKRERDRSGDRKKKKEKERDEPKEKVKKELDSDEEVALRERLLEKKAARRSEDDVVDGGGGDVPTKIANQRKRKDSDSNSD